MRIPGQIVACLTVVSLTALLSSAVWAQQSVPDAPQPQKKQTLPPPAAKAPDPAPPPASSPAADDNAFPEDVSRKAAAAADQTTQPDNGGDNPFPEDESKAAAKAAGNDDSSSRPKEAAPVLDPARSVKDSEVGSFYLSKGDYQGALLRYQEAAATDPTNVNALFGLAQTQHMLKKNAEAVHNYELYLDIVPNGPKAKQALKALKEIQTGK